MKISQLRKIIREEVKSAMNEELKAIITEAITVASTPNSQPHITKEAKQPVKKSFSQLVNEDRQPVKEFQFESNGNPVMEALNATAASGEWRNINGGSYNAQDAVGWSGGGPMAGAATPVVSSVDEMMKGKRANDVTQVSIDSVPDFSQMMGTLKEKGKL
tara:strand:- start:99 stop:578 length:480 start_codon:yes stop_codon:yes gene_type:complete